MAESLKKMTDKINEFWAGLSRNQKMKIIASFIVILIGIILLVYFISRPTYSLLFSGLSPADAGKVADALDNQYKIPYKLENGGTTILVPKQDRDKLRIELASGDLLDNGFSIDDAFTGSMSTTDMEREKRYNYFLQNEIENSIKTIDGVKEATVLISQPGETPMVLNTDEKPVTAAVKVNMASGNMLSQEQVNGIIQFVSKSVPGLKPENVTVMDGNGELLSSNDSTTLGSANSQMQLKREVEETLRRNLQSMLGMIYGTDKVVVSVSVPLNFDYYKTDKTSYDPNSNEMGDVINENSAIRSYQQLKQSSTGTQNGGAAGTNTNVPPIYPTGNNNNSSSSDSTNTTINYELNEIKEEFVRAQGQIDSKSITVSVAINNSKLSDTDKNNIKDLIKNAVGLTGDMGQITVLGQTFANPPLENTPSQTKNPIKTYLLIAGITAAAIVGLLLMRRQLMRRKESESQSVVPIIQQTPIEIAVKEDENDPRKQIERLIKQKPDVVAQLIRTWLNEE